MQTPGLRAPYAAAALLMAAYTGQVACARDVSAPSPTRGVSAITTVPSLSLVAGRQASIVVHVARDAGFTNPVSLAASGLPSDVSVTFAPNPVIGDSAVVVIHVNGTVAAGVYHMKLAPIGALEKSGSASLALEVTAPPLVSVTVPYCNALAPRWVAFQDGDDEWTPGVPVVSGGQTSFHHDFASPRGAIATVARNGPQPVLRVLYGTPAELESEGDTLRADCDIVSSKTWLGTVDGLYENEKALVSMGPDFRASALPTRNDFKLLGVSAGPQDLLAARTTQLGNGTAITGLILRRDVDIPDGGQLPSFDFASSEVFAPTLGTLSILGGGANLVSLTELTTRNSRVTLPFINDSPSATTRPYAALPLSQLRAEDLQMVHVSTDAANVSARTADVYFRSSGDRTVTLGPTVPAPVIGIQLIDTYVHAWGVFDLQQSYGQSTSVVFSQSNPNVVVSITMTASYPEPGTSSFALVVPDFVGVPGFQYDWSLRPGPSVDWTATRTGGSAPLGRSALPKDGDVRRTVLFQGTIDTP